MVQIKTAHGVYKIKQPGGPLGTRHMCLLMKISEVDGLMKIPTGDTEDKGLAERIRMQNEKIVSKAMMDVFAVWAPEVLPHIVEDGPFKYENMPGEDQFAIFVAMSSEMKMSDDFFQVIPEASH